MKIKERMRCWRDGHKWGPWQYGYPSVQEVYQYSECKRCGKARKNKIVGRGENPPEWVRKKRDKRTNKEDYE